MKIININSGLGNQMFQYAFILNYKIKGEKIKLDIIQEEKVKYHNGYELSRIFSIKEDLISKKERTRLLGIVFPYKGAEFHFYRLLRKITKTLFGDKKFKSQKYIHEDETLYEYNFNKKYLEIDKNIDSYFYGFFQSHRYFEDIKEEVNKIYTFPDIEEYDQKNFEILKKIRANESVSIHIRRNDYLANDLFKVLDINYYEDAFNFIKDKLENKELSFFVFSDDISWCKENLDFLKKEKVFYIDWNKKENSYKDMQLMSECHHNIIPNSTFSWWGGYLNKNINKIVIAPKYWFKGVKTTEDRCPKDWFLI